MRWETPKEGLDGTEAVLTNSPAGVATPHPVDGPGGGWAAVYRAAALPASTRAAYEGDWVKFTTWCARGAHSALPASPGVVGEYLAQAAALVDETGAFVYAPATLARWAAGINAVHRASGHPAPGTDPDVSAVLRGIRATRQTPPRRAKPFRLTHLTAVLEVIETRTWPASVIGRRDAALLLLGFAGALRRSELARLHLRDVELGADGDLVVRIRSSKTDQDALGASIAYPRGSTPVTCPACRLLDWAAVLHAFLWEGRVGLLRQLHLDRSRGTGHACSRATPRNTWTSLVADQPRGPVFRTATKAPCTRCRHRHAARRGRAAAA